MFISNDKSYKMNTWFLCFISLFQLVYLSLFYYYHHLCLLHLTIDSSLKLHKLIVLQFRYVVLTLTELQFTTPDKKSLNGSTIINAVFSEE